MLRIALTIALVITPQVLLAQANPPSTTGADISQLTTFELYVKIGGAVVAGLVALIGLPAVYLGYKKTSAELAKLDLESQLLRQKLAEPVSESSSTAAAHKGEPTASGIAPTQQFLDPRILGPQLVILDFIVVYILLTLATAFLGIFDLGGSILSAALSVVLLVPVAKQAARVSASFNDTRSRDEIAARISLIKYATTASFVIFLVVAGLAVAFGVFLNSKIAPGSFAREGRILGIVLIAIGVVAFAFARRVRAYLVDLGSTS